MHIFQHFLQKKYGQFKIYFFKKKNKNKKIIEYHLLKNIRFLFDNIILSWFNKYRYFLLYNSYYNNNLYKKKVEFIIFLYNI